MGFVLTFVMAIFAWRTNPLTALRIALRLGAGILITTIVASIPGFILFLYRTRHASLSLQSINVLHWSHHFLGYVFISAFVWYWPLLFVVSVGRPRTVARKFVLAVGAISCLLLFLFLSFTGYLLPEGLPRNLTLREASWAFRFFVLHVMSLPLFAFASLLILLQRHRRAIAVAA